MLRLYFIDHMKGTSPVLARSVGQALRDWLSLGYNLNDLISVKKRIEHCSEVSGKGDFISMH